MTKQELLAVLKVAATDAIHDYCNDPGDDPDLILELVKDAKKPSELYDIMVNYVWQDHREVALWLIWIFSKCSYDDVR